MDQNTENDDKVVNLFEAKTKMTEPEVDKSYEAMHFAMSEALEVIANYFDNAIIIGMLDNNFQVGTTIEETGDVIDMMLAGVSTVAKDGIDE